MIRFAQISDVPAIVDMGCKFNASLPDPMPFYRDHAELRAQQHLMSQDCYSALLEIDGSVVGMLLAQITPANFAPIKLAKEVLFWIEPKHRGNWMRTFLSHYENWARSKGCQLVGIGSIAGNERAAKVFARIGYMPIETVMAKKI